MPLDVFDADRSPVVSAKDQRFATERDKELSGFIVFGHQLFCYRFPRRVNSVNHDRHTFHDIISRET